MEAVFTASIKETSESETVYIPGGIVESSSIWKMEGQWVLHLPLTLLSGQCRRRMDIGERQLIVKNSVT